MTRRARPCLHCGRLTEGSTYCPACQAARWAEQGRARGPRPWYSGDWSKLRAAHLEAHPTCAWQNPDCRGRLEVDHVTPRSLDGGLMTLCAHHHHIKSQRDGSRERGGVGSRRTGVSVSTRSARSSQSVGIWGV